MKTFRMAFIVGIMLFSGAAFAQPVPPQPPVDAAVGTRPVQPAGQAEWAALMKKQAEARKALNDQLNAERDAFLKDHPEFAARFEAQMKEAKERAEARKAAMQVKPEAK